MTKHEADVIGGLNMTDQISNEAYKQIMIAAQEENEVGDVLDKITEEIEKYKADCGKPEDIGYFSEVNQRTKGAYETCLRIINYWRNEVN